MRTQTEDREAGPRVLLPTNLLSPHVKLGRRPPVHFTMGCKVTGTTSQLSKSNVKTPDVLKRFMEKSDMLWCR